MKLTDENIQEIKRQYDMLHCDILNDREHKWDDYRKRNEFQRDYSRILYSNAFRRLQGKMQILGIHPSAFFRNRLTHSLEVGQVAYAIGEKLREACRVESMYTEDEMFVLQAAALAHDIGHPAFGHSGERVLDSIGIKLKKPLRFEGNAQNFRVLRVIEKKDAKCKGLNLTNRTLLAINKYLNCENPFFKYKYMDGEAIPEPMISKYLYKDDYEYLKKVRKEAHLLNARTLDVQIIDIADEIAYTIHDLEDGLALHSFSIDELIYELKNYRDKNLVSDDNPEGNLEKDKGYIKFLDIVKEVKKKADESSSYKTIQEYSQVFRKEMLSHLTHEFIEDLTLAQVDGKFAAKHGVNEGNWEIRLNVFYNLRKALSDTLFKCISRDPIIEDYERRGFVVVDSLFKILNNDSKLLPPDFRKQFNPDESQERLSMDYISGMMDTYAIQEFEKYCAQKFSEIKL